MQEDDDDFGELYTDVLTSFTSPPSLPVENGVSIKNDRSENNNSTQFNGGGSNSHQELNRIGLDEPARVLKIDSNANLPKNGVLGFDDPNLVDESLINIIEENDGDDVVIGDSLITAFSIPAGVLGEDYSDSDDSDSVRDSDDGLQIVLNDDNVGQIRDGEEVHEDGNVMVDVDEAAERRGIKDQEWHQDIGMLHGGFDVRDEDGEKKELEDGLVKVDEVVQPPNIGVGYNKQFHSQFKYMGPAAAPLGGLVCPEAPPGHGRGDYHPAGLKNAPPMQKGYGMPVWANNTPGHGLGRGLDFTLPSYKTVFEVDINSFEEKPWRLPGIDISDYFNFGLNEDTWKDYCKQLEQLRVGATMQSKIRVYESGRTEQDYDPDMPPELVAATGIHDISADKTNFGKAEVVHTDIAKGSMGARRQLPTGRAIQVETGFGERLPSIDTRPPRMRDSDVIIEIVLKDSVDDDFVNRNDITKLPGYNSREGLRGGHDNKEVNAQEDTEISDSTPEAYNNQKRELVGRTPLDKPVYGRMIGDGNSRFMLDASIQNSSSSDKNPVYAGPHQDERGEKGRNNRSPSNGHSWRTSDTRLVRNQKDESAENIEFKRRPHSSAYRTRGFTEKQYFEEEDAIHDEQPDGSFELDRVDVDMNMEVTHKDEYLTLYLKKKKMKIQNELPLEDVDDGEGSKAAKSSENSKAISGSSGDYRNLPYGTEDEVVQDGRSTRMRIKRKVNEGDRHGRSKGREERQVMDRHHMVTKGRDDLYYCKKWDSSPSHPTHYSLLKSDVIDRRKESDNLGGSWLRKDEESHGRRTRFDDPRKRVHSNEMGPRHRSKVREIEQKDFDQYLLRKQLDNGSWTGGYHDRFRGSRHWNRDDNSKSRSDNFDYLHGKRRKEDIHLKRNLGEKEELLHVRRGSTNRQNRERDDIMELRNRDEIARIRNNDQQSMIHKEEIWFPRERVDRQRDDWQRLKRSHEETLSKREREDVRGVKTGRTGENKSCNSHFRVKDELKASDREYHLKDLGYNSEKHRRKDNVKTENLLRHRVSEDIYSRETRPSNDERRSRQERPSAQNDRAVFTSEHHRMPEKKHEEYPRKSKESEEDFNFVVPSKLDLDDHYSQISEQVKMEGMIEPGSGDQVIPVSHQSSSKHKKDAFSDDEQHELMRGSSKLERCTSHKERDFNAPTNSSSLNVKDIDEHKKIRTLAANRVPDESLKMVETGQNSHSLASERDAEDQVNKDGEVKPKEDNHLDSVAKLKKRSELFKLPMPSENELGAVKKMENEQLPPVQTDRKELEIKQEQAARKRRGSGS